MEGSDTTTPVVPLGRSGRYGRCGSCTCPCTCGGVFARWCQGPFWWTKWLRTRLGNDVSTKTAGALVALLTFFLVGFGAATVFLNLECTRSNPLEILYTSVVAAGLVSTLMLLWAALRDPYYNAMVEETEEEVKEDRVKSVATFVVLVLLGVACVVVDISAMYVSGSCGYLKDWILPSGLHTSTAFHAVRLVFVVAQVCSVGWLHATRKWAKQTVGAASLTALIVMADAASWLYQVSESTDVICNTSSCWSAVAPTTSEPVVDRRRPRDFHGKAAVVWFALLVVMCVFSVALFIVTQQALPPAAETTTAPRWQTTTPRWQTTTPRWQTTTPPTTAAPKYADYQAVLTYQGFKVAYVFIFALTALSAEARSSSAGRLDYRPHAADIALLVLGAIGTSAFHLLSFFALARSESVTGEDLGNSGCHLSVPPEASTFIHLRALLGLDASLSTLLIIFQTTFLLTALCKAQDGGSLNTRYNLLALFNLCLWINGSFFEVQSEPTTTCWTSPVQRVAIVGYWNKLVHLFYPLCMLYWLLSLVATLTLRLRSAVLSPHHEAGRRVQPGTIQPAQRRLEPLTNSTTDAILN
ncbi:PREDICTED: uncharacterized protein LOC109481641 [Branchiostoma belcheri]|uniref:Uncharacterized protein LOC109481641 n=1 Tax=Branchiostoma belcheri TaxID=7741 RepID=A0A6P4ZSG8_BRABE|nr:PREDICTED: uncharacterized protein LOC109481641 [Branchiostoma belcheri]